VMRDITDRQKAEDAQRLAAVGQLASGVAHEFNNLLTGMIWRAELAAQDRTVEQYEKLTELVTHAGLRGSDICRNLMAFARPNEPKRQALTVDTAIEASLAVATHQIENTGIVVARDYATAGRCVDADPRQLEQVILNLVINACQAMPEGGRLTIATKYAANGPGGGEVIVAITDTGIGIRPEHMNRIFDPFFTTKAPVGDGRFLGTGLGLSVSAGIVRAHGGTIRASSEIGAGSIFEVVLPAAEEPESPPTDRGQGGDVTSRSGERRRTARVLVADDREELAALIEAYLVCDGHEVVCVHSTPDAVSALGTDRFDLVITDLLMPGGGGREVLSVVRTLPEPPQVLVITGLLEEEVEAEVVAMGAAGCLRKPFTRAGLARAVDALLADDAI
jgi:two-component system cell cycle sensor histidine kinase/response regulator CckA